MRPQAKRSWIAVGVVVVLMAVAFVINRTTKASSSDDGVRAPDRQSLIAKADLPACPATAASGGVANGLPKLTLPCLGHGPKVDLARLRGPAIVNIWAGTCPPCRAEAPLLRDFAAKTTGKVLVLGVVDGAYPGETWDDALDASRGLALRYPSVFDARGRLAIWARSAGIPVSLFVAADGSVVYTNVGQLEAGDLQRLSKQYLDIEITS